MIYPWLYTDKPESKIKIPNSKQTVSDTDNITWWDQRKHVQITDENLLSISKKKVQNCTKLSGFKINYWFLSNLASGKN